MIKYHSYANSSFWKHYEKLPKQVQQLADKAYQIFKENPYHPGLQFKKVGNKQPVYSARITNNYRAICLLVENNVYWFWIGNHDDYEKLIATV
jgi:mRNA-degrading endonuclease RelE of RelBE toxin-antitoxin system